MRVELDEIPSCSFFVWLLEWKSQEKKVCLSFCVIVVHSKHASKLTSFLSLLFMSILSHRLRSASSSSSSSSWWEAAGSSEGVHHSLCRLFCVDWCFFTLLCIWFLFVLSFVVVDFILLRLPLFIACLYKVNFAFSVSPSDTFNTIRIRILQKRQAAHEKKIKKINLQYYKNTMLKRDVRDVKDSQLNKMEHWGKITWSNRKGFFQWQKRQFLAFLSQMFLFNLHVKEISAKESGKHWVRSEE